MRLLVVEDSGRMRDALKDGLGAAGYAVDAVGDGRQGLIYSRTTAYDLIVLDMMIPEMDGLSLLRELRGSGSSTPVLILSARDRVEHRVEGLRAGADDYLVKPFSFDELLARVEALCRRAHGATSSTITVAGLTLDLERKRFLSRGVEIEFTRREYAILEYLMINAGRTLTRNEVEEHVYAADRQVWSNAVDSAVACIRRKLAEAGVKDLIRTRRGQGYEIARDESGVRRDGATP